MWVRCGKVTLGSMSINQNQVPLESKKATSSTKQLRAKASRMEESGEKDRGGMRGKRGQGMDAEGRKWEGYF